MTLRKSISRNLRRRNIGWGDMLVIMYLFLKLKSCLDHSFLNVDQQGQSNGHDHKQYEPTLQDHVNGCHKSSKIQKNSWSLFPFLQYVSASSQFCCGSSVAFRYQCDPSDGISPLECPNYMRASADCLACENDKNSCSSTQIMDNLGYCAITCQYGFTANNERTACSINPISLSWFFTDPQPFSITIPPFKPLTSGNQNDITYSLLWTSRDFENYNNNYDSVADATAAWDADYALNSTDRTISKTAKSTWLNNIEIAMYDDDNYNLSPSGVTKNVASNELTFQFTTSNSAMSGKLSRLYYLTVRGTETVSGQTLVMQQIIEITLCPERGDLHAKTSSSAGGSKHNTITLPNDIEYDYTPSGSYGIYNDEKNPLCKFKSQTAYYEPSTSDQSKSITTSGHKVKISPNTNSRHKYYYYYIDVQIGTAATYLQKTYGPLGLFVDCTHYSVKQISNEKVYPPANIQTQVVPPNSEITFTWAAFTFQALDNNVECDADNQGHVYGYEIEPTTGFDPFVSNPIVTDIANRQGKITLNPGQNIVINLNIHPLIGPGKQYWRSKGLAQSYVSIQGQGCKTNTKCPINLNPVKLWTQMPYYVNLVEFIVIEVECLDFDATAMQITTQSPPQTDLALSYDAPTFCSILGNGTNCAVYDFSGAGAVTIPDFANKFVTYWLGFPDSNNFLDRTKGYVKSKPTLAKNTLCNTGQGVFADPDEFNLMYSTANKMSTWKDETVGAMKCYYELDSIPFKTSLDIGTTLSSTTKTFSVDYVKNDLTTANCARTVTFDSSCGDAKLISRFHNSGDTSKHDSHTQYKIEMGYFDYQPTGTIQIRLDQFRIPEYIFSSLNDTCPVTSYGITSSSNVVLHNAGTTAEVQNAYLEIDLSQKSPSSNSQVQTIEFKAEISGGESMTKTFNQGYTLTLAYTVCGNENANPRDNFNVEGQNWGTGTFIVDAIKDTEYALPRNTYISAFNPTAACITKEWNVFRDAALANQVPYNDNLNRVETALTLSRQENPHTVTQFFIEGSTSDIIVQNNDLIETSAGITYRLNFHEAHNATHYKINLQYNKQFNSGGINRQAATVPELDAVKLINLGSFKFQIDQYAFYLQGISKGGKVTSRMFKTCLKVKFELIAGTELKFFTHSDTAANTLQFSISDDIDTVFTNKCLFFLFDKYKIQFQGSDYSGSYLEISETGGVNVPRERPGDIGGVQDQLIMHISDPTTGAIVVDPTICNNVDFKIKPVYDPTTFVIFGTDYSGDELASDQLSIDICTCNTVVLSKRYCQPSIESISQWSWPVGHCASHPNFLTQSPSDPDYESSIFNFVYTSPNIQTFDLIEHVTRNGWHTTRETNMCQDLTFTVFWDMNQTLPQLTIETDGHTLRVHLLDGEPIPPELLRGDSKTNGYVDLTFEVRQYNSNLLHTFESRLYFFAECWSGISSALDHNGVIFQNDRIFLVKEFSSGPTDQWGSINLHEFMSWEDMETVGCDIYQLEYQCNQHERVLFSNNFTTDAISIATDPRMSVEVRQDDPISLKIFKIKIYTIPSVIRSREFEVVALVCGMQYPVPTQFFLNEAYQWIEEDEDYKQYNDTLSEIIGVFNVTLAVPYQGHNEAEFLQFILNMTTLFQFNETADYIELYNFTDFVYKTCTINKFTLCEDQLCTVPFASPFLQLENQEVNQSQKIADIYDLNPQQLVFSFNKPGLPKTIFFNTENAGNNFYPIQRLNYWVCGDEKLTSELGVRAIWMMYDRVEIPLSEIFLNSRAEECPIEKYEILHEMALNDEDLKNIIDMSTGLIINQHQTIQEWVGLITFNPFYFVPERHPRLMEFKLKGTTKSGATIEKRFMLDFSMKFDDYYRGYNSKVQLVNPMIDNPLVVDIRSEEVITQTQKVMDSQGDEIIFLWEGLDTLWDRLDNQTLAKFMSITEFPQEGLLKSFEIVVDPNQVNETHLGHYWFILNARDPFSEAYHNFTIDIIDSHAIVDKDVGLQFAFAIAQSFNPESQQTQGNRKPINIKPTVSNNVGILTLDYSEDLYRIDELLDQNTTLEMVNREIGSLILIDYYSKISMDLAYEKLNGLRGEEEEQYMQMIGKVPELVSYAIISFSDRHIDFKLQFSNPLYVSSQRVKDYVSVKFIENRLFMSKKDNFTLAKNFEIENIKVPAQIPSEQELQIITTVTGSTKYSLVFSLLIPFIFSMFASASMDRVWSLYYLMQIMSNIINYVYLQIPSNFMMVIGTINNVVCFALFTNPFVQRIAFKYIFKPEFKLNWVKTITMDLGIDLTSQVYFFITLGIFQIGSKFQRTKNYSEKKKKEMMWNGYLSGKIVCYLPTVLLVGCQINQIFGRKNDVDLARVGGFSETNLLKKFYIYMYLATVLALPAFSYYILKRNFKNLDKQEFKDMWGSLYTNLNTRKKDVITYNTLFCLKRLVVGVACVYINEFIVANAFINIMSSITMLIYVSQNYPMEQPFINKLEFINESTVLFFSYSFFIFTDWAGSVEAKYLMGKWLLAFTCIQISVNLAVISHNLYKDVIFDRKVKKAKAAWKEYNRLKFKMAKFIVYQSKVLSLQGQDFPVDQRWHAKKVFKEFSYKQMAKQVERILKQQDLDKLKSQEQIMGKMAEFFSLNTLKSANANIGQSQLGLQNTPRFGNISKNEIYHQKSASSSSSSSSSSLSLDLPSSSRSQKMSYIETRRREFLRQRIKMNRESRSNLSGNIDQDFVQGQIQKANNLIGVRANQTNN